MSTFLKKPHAGSENREGRYERYNLMENPFPSMPVINKSNTDIRYNGKIYEPKIREMEYNRIEKNFLKISQNDPNHIRLGFILDASYVGRGNGKSAFSLELMRRINSNFLLDISDNENKCFCIHISPEPSGRTKTFYSFVDLMFEGILNQSFIEYSLAVLRLEGIIALDPGFDIDRHFKDDDELIRKLNDNEWFEQMNITVAHLTERMFNDNSQLRKTSEEFPLRKDKRQFYNSRISSKHTIKDFYYNTLKKGKERIDFVFNDLVYFFEASGFNGAFFIIDDFERIPDFQSDRLKRDFALELRTNFFDGISENAKRGFYNLFLILHAGVPRLIEKAWSDTGMERRSPLSSESVGSRHIVSFNKLTLDHAYLLLRKYLEEYRIHPQNTNPLLPFTKEAVAVLSEKTELNAASLLEKAHGILEKAVDQGIKEINENFIKEYFGSNEIVEENLQIKRDSSWDLFQKATEE